MPSMDEGTGRGEVSALGSSDGLRWGTRGKTFGKDGGGGRQGEGDRRDLGDGERVEQREQGAFGVAGGEGLVSVWATESKECRHRGNVLAMRWISAKEMSSMSWWRRRRR